MTKSLGRRGILKGLALSPLGAAAAAEQAKIGLMTGGTPVVASGRGLMGVSENTSAAAQAPLRFLNFASWFKDVGHKQIAKSAQRIDGIDPDILEMRLPMPTKVRMQRRRNFDRIVEDRKDWFSRIVSRDGAVSWWE